MAMAELGFSVRSRHEDEIVASDMSDEILLSAHFVHGLHDQLRRVQQHAIAGRVAVAIVIGLEVVQIAVTHGEGDAVLQPFAHELLDHEIARELRERIHIRLL